MSSDDRDTGEDAQRREKLAHYTSEILVRWLGAKPGAGAEQVEAYAPLATSAAEELINVCTALSEEPWVTAQREEEELQHKADLLQAEQEAAEDQAKKDADAARMLAEAEGQ